MESKAIIEKRDNWGLLYRIAGIAAVLSVAIIPIQIVFFIVSPPPETVIGFFSLFQKSIFSGLIALDLLYLVNNALGLVLFPALCISLRRINKSMVVIALILGVAGSASFFISNTAFNMLHLYNQYMEATTEIQKSIYIAAGESMLAIYQGTAYHMHYILGSLSLLFLSMIMLNSKIYKNSTAAIGIVTNIVAFGLYIPKIGVYISASSALGYGIWFILIAIRFFKLAQYDQLPTR